MTNKSTYNKKERIFIEQKFFELMKTPNATNIDIGLKVSNEKEIRMRFDNKPIYFDDSRTQTIWQKIKKWFK